MPKKSRNLSFLQATSIGVGGMVGGGIFAVLGLATQLAGAGTPFAFAVAGVVALVSTYSYIKLSLRYPNKGGTVIFLDKAFGKGLFSGSLNILLWLSYIIMLSLYSSAFGNYGASYFPSNLRQLGTHILISLIVIAVTLLNTTGASDIGRAEEWIVIAKLSILLLFIVVGLPLIDWSRLSLSRWESPVSLISGGMIIFVAYEGFELIANSAGDIKKPKKNLPRSFFTSVIFVVILYILVALVTVGTLPVSRIVEAKEYALAEAAKPGLGAIGFNLITIAALLSTTSAINATLYGSARFSYIIAKEGELPEFIEHKIWRKPLEGLFITSGAVLFAANFFNLSDISILGSSGFLLIFAMVNFANVKMAKETSSKKWPSMFGGIVCLVALALLIIKIASDTPKKILIIVGMLVLSLVIEMIYRYFVRKHRK